MLQVYFLQVRRYAIASEEMSFISGLKSFQQSEVPLSLVVKTFLFPFQLIPTLGTDKNQRVAS